jgi:hypothetical protein
MECDVVRLVGILLARIVVDDVANGGTASVDQPVVPVERGSVPALLATLTQTSISQSEGVL